MEMVLHMCMECCRPIKRKRFSDVNGNSDFECGEFEWNPAAECLLKLAVTYAFEFTSFRSNDVIEGRIDIEIQ